jgi:hypothetical protein
MSCNDGIASCVELVRQHITGKPRNPHDTIARCVSVDCPHSRLSSRVIGVLLFCARWRLGRCRFFGDDEFSLLLPLHERLDTATDSHPFADELQQNVFMLLQQVQSIGTAAHGGFRVVLGEVLHAGQLPQFG